MGRSRRVSNPAEEDTSQRSRRKRTTSNGEDLLSATTGQGSSEGKRALYHCNYCNKSIGGKIHIKCVQCPNFDLCLECFSVGAEVTPHKSNHPYRIMDNLSFPLISIDWNADEEILFLEGMDVYGLGNWTNVADNVGTKSKVQCIDHYTTAYMNSPYFPLPDMSHVVGKNRKELLAMAEGKKGFPTLMELNLKQESSFSPSRVKIEEAAVGQSLSNLAADGDSRASYISTNIASASAVKKASNTAQIKDNPVAIKMEDSHVNKSVRGKKLKSSRDMGPSMENLSGYNIKRQEFDPEYDNDAEQLLAEMEFKDTDTEAEHELKLRLLHIYLKRLGERKRRKDFILERNLLYADPLEKELSLEERQIYQDYKVFMRFHSKEEHDELIKTVIDEHRIRKRIQELKEARAAGCRTSTEANRYHEQKRKKEAEEIGPTGKVHHGIIHPKGEPERFPRGGVNGSSGLESHVKDSSTQASSSSIDNWDITGLPGSDLLSVTEQRLCCEIKMLPSHYLRMQEVMSVQIFKGNITKKTDAHRFFEVDPSKVGRVYDMLVKKGIAQP